ncbi:hypothetical protein QCA50_018701 [Cerrena zonata]|uniref:CxC2-like cysteine cluster KDZ transposase-associated domain-containing protein n=1 Tax=Cerrena zonata TaxID=2478898 RepID=A0AAW0FE01_9APHY
MPCEKQNRELVLEDALNNTYFDPGPRSRKSKKTRYTKVPVPGPAHSPRRPTLNVNESNTLLNSLQHPPDTSAPDISDAVHHAVGSLPVKGKSPNDYMREYVESRQDILYDIVARDAPPSVQKCLSCHSINPARSMQWRCHSCFGEPVFCTICLCDSHQQQPFHHISCWNENYFYPSTLHDAGLTLNLGHGGSLCPEYGSRHQGLPERTHHPSQDIENTHHSPDINGNTSPEGPPISRTIPMVDGTPISIPTPEPIPSRFWEYEDFNLYETSPLQLPPSLPVQPLSQTPPVPPLQQSSRSTTPPVSSPPPPRSSPKPIFHQVRATHYRIRRRLVEIVTDEDPFYQGSSEDEGEEPASVQNTSIALKSQHTDQSYDKFQCPLMTIVDMTGVHKLRVRFCRCHSLTTNPLHKQLQLMGLFPASRKKTRTAFTFGLLEHFDISNLEGKVSAYTYYNCLIRLTSNVFPKTVPNRYRELMRASRQWRDLMLRRRAGHPFVIPDAEISPGGLALFCPTCPQPGVNLPENWKDDPKQWKYMPTLLADGNFKQDHLAMKNGFDDVALNDGLAYMVSRKRFDAYITEAPIVKALSSTCHEHRAVSQQNHTQAHLDITGIGAIACGRHGCFYPNSIVNFRKGEGQRYMDYAFVNAINYIAGLSMVMMIYDIMCQYFLNFKRRVSSVSNYLSLPPNIKIKKAIGLFHIHGHVKQCFARYAPTFIRGAGMLVGEIIETLWNPLNHTASSAQAMSWHHRQEYIDTHVGDSNWKKLINMVPTLFKNWELAVKQVHASTAYFEALCETVSPENTRRWTELEEKLQVERENDISVMDNFDISDEKELGKAATAGLWIRKEIDPMNGILPGSAKWISSGIQISEEQMELAMDIRKSGSRPSPDRQSAIHDKRVKLQKRIDEFHRSSNIYLPPANDDSIIPIDPREDSDWELDDEGELVVPGSYPEDVELDPGIVDLPNSSLPAEKQTLLLPSAFGRGECAGRLKDITKVELAIRTGQANDTLHALRLAIGQKSFVFRNKVRKGHTNPNSGYHDRLRNYAEVQTIGGTIDYLAKVYMSAHKAMISLNASDETMSKYQVLHKSDVGANTAIVNFNAAGQRNATLSWIWQRHHSATEDPVWIQELYRVNWLRAKCRKDRWDEELELIKSELHWTKLYYQHKSS